MGLRVQKYTHLSMLNSFSQSCQKQFNEKQRVFKHGCWYKGIATHQPRKKGRREEGRREIEEGRGKERKNKKEEKRKKLALYFESLTKSNIYKISHRSKYRSKNKKDIQENRGKCS